jgi:flavin reductase (DIM6/NTAB) family NADH-FMN oxidoreductase RutF
MAAGEQLGAAALKSVMGRFATGVTIVTAIDGVEPVGFTCQSFVSLSLEPSLVALAPAKSSTSWPRISRAGTFCVNVLADTQRDTCRAFAFSGADKFSGVAWTPASGGAPIIDGSIAWVECALELVHDAGDHEIVIGRVRAFGQNEGSPLLYYRGEFGELQLAK